jgi:hypothetical protein
LVASKIYIRGNGFVENYRIMNTSSVTAPPFWIHLSLPLLTLLPRKTSLRLLVREPMNMNQMSLIIIVPKAFAFSTCRSLATVNRAIIPLCREMYVEMSREVAFCSVSERANVTLEGPGVVEKMFADWGG